MRMITIEMEKTKVYQGPITACIGYFDGVHLGHQALIRRTVETARKNGSEPSLITFDPDPWVAIKGIDPSTIRHISTFRERLDRIVELGIVNVIILKFTHEMSALSSQEFCTQILGRLNIQAMICGFDFHYGYMGKGNGETLQKELQVPVHIVEAVEDEKGKISSTRITQAIQSGDMDEVRHLLGTDYRMSGTVVHGRHIGTSLGFPTANIDYLSEYLVPACGVYAGYVIVKGRKHMAMINVGHNPTVNWRNDISIEAHILDFDEDIYGCQIRVDFHTFLRAEQKFASRDNLILQLEQDAAHVRRIFA